MRVYCSFDMKYDFFLKKVVNLILDKYGSQLNLVTLEEIELVNQKKLPYESDGKALNRNKIIVSSRLYELLPTLEINNLSNNDDYIMLRKTLYHEMGHINDMSIMPELYDCVLENFESGNINADSIVALFWIEYVAEKRTAVFENVYNMEICDELVKRKWHCTLIDSYAHYGESNFFYLTKLLPYFMARTKKEDIRRQYINRIENQLLVRYINEIDDELRFLETIGIFDDVSYLKKLCTVINKYYNEFMVKYKR